MSPDDFVKAARTLLGAQWRHCGRKPWALDCVGLISLSFKRSGMAFEDVKIYGREPVPGVLQAECQKRWGSALPRTHALAGDVALIRWGPKPPSHVGIIGEHDGALTLIHSHNIHGVVEQSLRGPIFSVVHEVYRPWGVA